MAILNTTVFKPLFGQKANLASLEKVAGQFIITDVGEIWVDKGTGESDRVKIGVFDSVATLNDLKSKTGEDLNRVYYVRDIKALAVYNSTVSPAGWEQINADTGATGVAYSRGQGGATTAPVDGEYISAASYDAPNRNIVFTVSKLTANNVEYKAAVPESEEGADDGSDAVSVEDALDDIYEAIGAGGSVAQKISDAIDALDVTEFALATASSGVVTIKGIKETDGKIAAGTDSTKDITFAKVATTGKAEDVEYKAATVGDNPTAAVSVKDQLDILTGNSSTVGSVDNKIQTAVQGLDVSEFALASQNNNVVTIKGIKEVDGKISVGDTGISLEEVAYTGAANDVSTTAITDGAAENPTTLYAAGTVQGTLQSIARDLDALETGSAVTISKSTDVSGIAARYTLSQGGVALGTTIDIPADMVVSAGVVVDVVFKDSDNTLHEGSESGDDVTAAIKGSTTPTATDAGKYIKLTIAHAQSGSEYLYIKATDLVDIYTSGSQQGDDIQVTVANNQISAGLNASGIAASKSNYSIPDVYTVDDEVAANNFTDKVASGIYTESGGVYTKVVSGDTFDGEEIYYSKVAAHTESVQDALTRLDAAVGSGGSVDTKISNAINALDTTVTQTAGADGLALQVVEVDGKLTSVSGSIAANTYDAYGAATAAVAALDAEVANYTVGTGGADDSNVQTDGLKVKVTEVDGVLTGVTASIVANTYDAYGAASTAKSEVIGTSSDAASADTINGAKAYADAAVTAASLTWGTF